MEQTLLTETPTKKVYKENAIWGGTFLGGPLAAAYFIAENFKAFHQPDKARKTWIYTILFTIFLFVGVFLLPDNFPPHVIPIAYTVAAYYLTKHFQGTSIKQHGEAGGLFFNGWRVAAVGFIGLIITIIPVLGYALTADHIANGSMSEKSYGVTKNTIDYDSRSLTETEVDRLAEAMIKASFFDEEVTKYVYAAKVDNNYELSISVIEGTTTDLEAIRFFEALRSELQANFPNNKIVLVMVGDNLEDVRKRIE